jgi:Helix-hairpin-helix domain
MSTDWSFSAADFDAMIAGEGTAPAPVVLNERDEELLRLTRRIAGQYVEVLAGSLALAFMGKDNTATDSQLAAALETMLRLADACGAEELGRALREMDLLVRDWQERRLRRAAFIHSLRESVLNLCRCLEPEDAASLKKLVVYSRRSLPLLDELAALPGIGPRRLNRLYSAGLFTVEAVGAADPMEVAQVTGLPRKLAEEVVRATRSYADAERRKSLEELRSRATDQSSPPPCTPVASFAWQCAAYLGR